MVTETEFQRAVLDLAKLHHLHVAHFRPAKTAKGKWVTAVGADGVGYPDLTILGPQGVIWRELKTETGLIRPAQRIWLIWLQQGGQDAAIWRPADLVSGLIGDTLQRLAKPRPTITEEIDMFMPRPGQPKPSSPTPTPPPPAPKASA